MSNDVERAGKGVRNRSRPRRGVDAVAGKRGREGDPLVEHGQKACGGIVEFSRGLGKRIPKEISIKIKTFEQCDMQQNTLFLSKYYYRKRAFVQHGFRHCSYVTHLSCLRKSGMGFKDPNDVDSLGSFVLAYGI